MIAVVDASAMLCWCFSDERPKDADKILQQLVADGMVAPQHWPLELTNILRIAERRGRISNADAIAFIRLIGSLTIEIDAETARRAWVEVRAIAEADNLTTYDAAYLELALRRQGRLVSKDADLLRAAAGRSVPVLDVSC